MTTGPSGASFGLDPFRSDTLRLLVVCTANQARSPLGEVIAAEGLRRRCQPGEVRSAGTDAVVGAPAVDGSRWAARKAGLDLDHHRSQPVSDELVRWSNLIVTMEVRHVVELVADGRAPLEYTFTAVDLAQRAAGREQRSTDESIAAWVTRQHDDRTVDDVLAGTGRLEIADPIGRPRKWFRRTADDLTAALETVFDALYGPIGPG